MKEYLGLLPPSPGSGKDGDDHPNGNAGEGIDVSDPLADSFFHGVWNRCAKANTLIYEEVFHVYPTDRVHTFEELRAWKKGGEQSSRIGKDELRRLESLTGSLVEFPLEFLRDEDISPTVAEAIVPTRIFT